jgi:hypothetical protein
MSRTPLFTDSKAEDILREVLAQTPAFVPGRQPEQGDPGMALLQVVARYVQLIRQGINQAPDRNMLAFLDMLGFNLMPPLAARAPVVFQAIPTLGDGRIPARTRVGAKVAGKRSPVVFETQSAIALVSARLAEVVTLHPGRDAYADHSADSLAGRPFTLFTNLKPVPHEIYLAHNTLFALAGRSTIEIDVELTLPGKAPLEIAWEYWDGKLWRGFKAFEAKDLAGESFDGTSGFTRSGTIRLTADCAETVLQTINGYSGLWIRGRTVKPLFPALTVETPLVDRIQIRSLIDRSQPTTPCSAGLLPDTAFADQQKLDLTKKFQPFGANPQPTSAFYFACEEAFSKPGATVTLCYTKADTPSDEARELARQYQLDVNAAKQIVDQLRIKATQTKSDLEALGGPTLSDAAPPLFPAGQPEDWYHNEVRPPVVAARNWVAMAEAAAIDVFGSLGVVVDLCIAGAIVPGFGVVAAGYTLRTCIPAAGVIVALAEALKQLCPPLDKLPAALKQQRQALDDAVGDLKQKAQDAANTSFDLITLQHLLSLVNSSLTVLKNAWDIVVNFPIFLDQNLPGFIGDARTHYQDLIDRIDRARQAVSGSVVLLEQVIDLLTKLTPTGAAGLQGHMPPELPDAQLVWEYWDGGQWQALIQPEEGAAPNLLDTGTLSFSVPGDWEQTEVNSVQARWMRARVATGYYSVLRLISWYDNQSETINFTPMLDPRPPSLDNFSLRYIYPSPTVSPERCVTYNDFQWQDRTEEACRHGGTFAPFTPVQDRAPALYLGFDRPLPADLVSLYLDVQQEAQDDFNAQGSALTWEYWDGTAWTSVAGQDETRGLALPGMAEIVYPGVPPPPTAVVAVVNGPTLKLAEAHAADRFNPGDLISVSQDADTEVATVLSIDSGDVTLTTPLKKQMRRPTISPATFARFGTPRTWVRARLKGDEEPPKSLLNGIYPNAVYAEQTVTTENETVGSSNAQPNQAFFLRNAPVLDGEIAEVRELQGARAAVEEPMLRKELLQSGLSDGDIRTETDPRTGRVNAVWVRWQGQPHFTFSGRQDRHYTMERSLGRLQFGDDRHGRIPPAGADNIRIQIYRSGGGLEGNVPAGAISQLLAGVPAQSVKNIRAAEGGSAGETTDAVRSRGPKRLHTLGQAITLSDYEAMAAEASPAVAIARALPGSTGGITVMIVPQSPDAQPQPTFELKREVLNYLSGRAPAAAVGRISIEGPVYLPIGVEAVVAAKDLTNAGPVREEVLSALSAFLHPLTGGPDGAGWPIGRSVYLSDVASMLEGLPGVDYVQTLNLLLYGTPQGEVVQIPDGRIVAAGQLTITLSGSEG